MVEVWAMNPTPNSMYMAHQYRLLDCKRGFSANKSRKMVMKMFTISVVFFIFCCKFYTFFMFVCWCIVVRSAEWCSVFCSVLADRQQCLAICSQRYWQTVSSRRGPIYRARVYVFATHSQSVQNTFTECSQRVRFLYVTYSHYKSMVFDVQKYGFCRAKRGFLSYKSMVFVFWTLHCYNPFATHLQSVSSVVAICSQLKSLNLLCV